MLDILLSVPEAPTGLSLSVRVSYTARASVDTTLLRVKLGRRALNVHQQVYTKKKKCTRSNFIVRTRQLQAFLDALIKEVKSWKRGGKGGGGRRVGQEGQGGACGFEVEGRKGEGGREGRRGRDRRRYRLYNLFTYVFLKSTGSN